MNVPKAIEIAIATLLREFGNLPDGVTIRAWQTLPHDKTWKADTDRTFPMIDVRCSPATTDDNQATLQAGCAVLCGTKADDDRAHELVSVIYEAAQGVLDRLFSQFRTSSGSELSRFLALMQANAGANAFQFGGFTFGDAMAPFDQSGVNMIGTTLTVHYGRSDF